MSIFTSRIERGSFLNRPGVATIMTRDHRSDGTRDHRSDGNCLVPVVRTSGPQECVGGTSKFL